MRKNTLLIAMISLFLFASCEFKSKDRLEKEAFEIQQMAFDKIIESYDDIKTYNFIDEKQDARIKIIFSATDTTFKKRKLYKKIDGTDEMVKHIQLLKNVTSIISGLKKNKKILPDSILNILDEIKTDILEIQKDKYFASLDEEKKTRIAKFLKTFEHSLLVKRIDDIDEFSSELVFLYVSYWKATLSKLRRLVVISYIDINKKIDNLPEEIFNERKLREMMDEPFSESEILINMYKMKMKEDFMLGGKTFDENLKNLEIALEKLLLLNDARFGDIRTRKQLLSEIQEIKVLIGEDKN